MADEEEFDQDDHDRLLSMINDLLGDNDPDDDEAADDGD